MPFYCVSLDNFTEEDSLRFGLLVYFGKNLPRYFHFNFTSFPKLINGILFATCNKTDKHAYTLMQMRISGRSLLVSNYGELRKKVEARTDLWTSALCTPPAVSH